ncbi:hypothetical protein QTG54_015447 [Skeletonema marinoi]|uniref:Uncharacterized protein n=1 Tax=Skeletonema marinoi TaxID=267567 RepID=A0AAD9D5R3_9STRA|nr:hypothetical protein QTG54_015447 [Skeletonema marinoi]
MSVLTDPDSGLDTSPPDLPTGTATGGAAATVNDKNSFLPIPAINNRKRGVSWDIKDHYGGGQQQQQSGACSGPIKTKSGVLESSHRALSIGCCFKA